jgi:hypothetical protein
LTSLKVAAFPLTMPVLPTKLPLLAISLSPLMLKVSSPTLLLKGTIPLQTLPVVKESACAAATVRVNAAVKVTKGVRHLKEGSTETRKEEEKELHRLEFNNFYVAARKNASLLRQFCS